MSDLFYLFLKFFSLLIGAATVALGGYLSYLKNHDWGWFLAAGFMIIVVALIWCAEPKHNSEDRK